MSFAIRRVLRRGSEKGFAEWGFLILTRCLEHPLGEYDHLVLNMQGSAERSGPVNRFIFSVVVGLLGVRPAFSRPTAQTVHPNAPGLLCTPPVDKHREKGEACLWPTDRQGPPALHGLLSIVCCCF